MGFGEKNNKNSAWYQKRHPGERRVPYDLTQPILLPQSVVPKPVEHRVIKWIKRIVGQPGPKVDNLAQKGA
jgi:hypothetical protein